MRRLELAEAEAAVERRVAVAEEVEIDPVQDGDLHAASLLAVPGVGRLRARCRGPPRPGHHALVETTLSNVTAEAPGG